MICPKCGEDNSDNFRFCGMCGTLLEARRPVGAPMPSLAPPASPRTSPLTSPPTPPPRTNAPEPIPTLVDNASGRPNRLAPLISGPSMLGLNQPGPNPTSNSSSHQPSLDALRDRSFSGLDSFFEPEQPKMGGRRIVLLVVLLAALGGASWWTYTNYTGPAEGRKPTAPVVAPPSDADSSRTTAPSLSVPQGPSENAPSENATTAPESSPKAADAEPKPAPDEKPATREPATQPEARTTTPTPAPAPTRTAPAQKIAGKRESPVTSQRIAAKPSTASSAADTGDADFRKGEAYLYGRGMPENCSEAVKYLKSASAKSNAKARSAFGTMYATGHCTPRDLPTSYLWFALALKVDPNNQILEKDLSAVWNQMTPPERQMATRMKQ